MGSAVLRSEGAVAGGTREGKSALNIIDELDELLKHRFSSITIDCLLNLARKVYLRYMVTGAHNDALGENPQISVFIILGSRHLAV